MPANGKNVTRKRIPKVREAGSLAIEFGREICGDLGAAEKREWLVTNGIGGFASGTVAGLATRRYHGLLVAALQPPLARTLLVSKCEETANYDNQIWNLSTNRWTDGTIAPLGYLHIERFRLEGSTPEWTFAFSDALLEKRVWMQQNANTTYVEYRLVRSSGPVELAVKVLVNYRDYHSITRGADWRMSIQPAKHGLRINAFEGATPFYLLSTGFGAVAEHEWYRNFDLAAERFRGLEDSEDQLHAATFRAELQPGARVSLVASLDPSPNLDSRQAWHSRRLHEESVLERFSKAAGQYEAPAWIRQLVLAADQFIVTRPLPDEREAHTVIAGYHWFCDWGRDTMIALPGLTLSTGRPEIARSIVHTFSRVVNRGMLPNRFPDSGGAPEYNSVDATLWYIEALRQYLAATRDHNLLRELFPALAEIVAWHVRGTRYNIHVDPSDGLLYAGQPGVQLTWMDAKVGEWVVTPRIGKPIEINALWYNALVAMGEFARALAKQPGEYESRAKQARAGFARFWNESRGWCFDVIDGPEGDDPALRPNQLLAVSLPESPLNSPQQRAIVDACGRHLLTSHGLRSLAPSHPGYQGHYGGGPRERDAAYHQGTVWGWLLGPFALAHFRVYGDAKRAAAFLEPMAHHLREGGLGTASEIFDGDPPFTPRGCIAQAWTVAEILRAWCLISAQTRKPRTGNGRAEGFRTR